MIVEWARSCYQSEWRLFRDDSSATTAGRYYYAEPGTQHFPGFLNVGSRNWHDKNWGVTQGLGEDLESSQVWNPGTPPAQIPNAIILGTLDCLQNGETLPGIDYENLNDGIPIDCYGPGEKNPLWFEVSSYARCTLQRYYFAIVDWLYDDQFDLITNSIRNWLGPTVVVHIHPREGLLNAVVTIIHPQFSVAIMDGTRDFQTLALEAFQQFRRPTDFGIFGTLPLWYDSSSRVNAFLEADGAIAAAPVMLAGHSYGGAVAVVLAARYRHANTSRVVRYMTWGMPKPGDARLIKLLDLCEGINLVNDDDPVPSLPPDEISLLPVEDFLALPGLNVYLDWKRPTQQTVLTQRGKLSVDPVPLIGYTTLLSMVERALSNTDQLQIIGHRSPEYFRRTSLRCPRKEWPIGKKEWEEMQQPLPEFFFHSPIVPNTRLIFTQPITAPTPITPGPPPFPGTVPDFALGVLYSYIGGIQTPSNLGLKLLGVMHGIYRFTIVSTSAMGVLQGIEMQSVIPPTWTLDDNGSLAVPGFFDVTVTSDGEGLEIIFFDLADTHTWNVVFHVDLLP